MAQNVPEMAPNVSGSRAPIDRAEAKGEDFAHSRTFEWLARAGLVARGVIYAIIGILAIKLALGDGGKTTNQNGALETIAKQPFGKALLILMAIGLAGLRDLAAPACRDRPRPGVQRRHQGADRRLRERDRVRGALRHRRVDPARVGGQLGQPRQGDRRRARLAGRAGARGDRRPDHRSASGSSRATRGSRGSSSRSRRPSEMSESVERAFTALGVFGHLARMVVFVLIGYFLIRAAIDYNPDKAVSLDGALTALGQASYGPILLGIVAAGLIGFAAYSIADARYRRV